MPKRDRQGPNPAFGPTLRSRARPACALCGRSALWSLRLLLPLPLALLTPTIPAAPAAEALAAPAGTAEASVPTITVGIVDTFAPDFYVETYSPTLDRLQASVPEARFRFVEIDWRRVEEDVREARPDFLLSAASVFGTLRTSLGAQQIATREPSTSKDVARTVASTFIVRPENPAKTLGGLRGAKVAVTGKRSFDGWLIAQGEMAHRGLDPEKHFGEVIETEYGIPDVAALVRLGIADAGVLAACEYERLLREGLIRPKDFRILDARSSENGGGSAPPAEACVRSTDRYPDVVFASLPWADPEAVRAVTVSLLSMPAWSAADGTGYRWTVCSDFVPTMRLLETLRIGPYAYLRDMSLDGIWKRWKAEIILAGLLAAAVLFHLVTVNLLVRRRTSELQDAVTEVERFHKDAHDARRRVEMLERTGVVSQLSSLFAHEVKQPVMNVSLYAGALRMLLAKEGTLTPQARELLDALGGEVERTSQIIDHVRSYAKKRERTPVRCDLSELAREVVRLMPLPQRSGTSTGSAAVSVSSPISAEKLPRSTVLADPFEVEFVVSNFLKNALAATADVERPAVTVDIRQQDAFWKLTVTDNGPRIDDRVFETLGRVQESRKSDGLGFGLAIAAAIAEANGGHLEFARAEPTGLAASILLPAVPEVPTSPNGASAAITPNTTAANPTESSHDR